MELPTASVRARLSIMSYTPLGGVSATPKGQHTRVSFTRQVISVERAVSLSHFSHVHAGPQLDLEPPPPTTAT